MISSLSQHFKTSGLEGSRYYTHYRYSFCTYYMLNSTRCPDAVTKLLLSTESQKIESGGIQATRLYTHTDDVGSTNQRKLNELQSDSRTYTACDSCESMRRQIDSLCLAPHELTLKIGAQVSKISQCVRLLVCWGCLSDQTSFKLWLPHIAFTHIHTCIPYAIVVVLTDTYYACKVSVSILGNVG